MSLSGPVALVHRTLSAAVEPVLKPAFYPYNDTSLPQAERDYLKSLANHAAEQNLAESNQAYLRGLSIAFTAFATFMVGLRFLARWRQNARILIDDWFILLALALLYGDMILNLVSAAHGMGLHSGRMTADELKYLLHITIGGEIVYVTSVTCYKIALLLLYFRVFPVPQVRLWGLWCGGVTLGWGITCSVAACLQCVPLNKVWQPWVHGGCINLFLTQLFISVPSTLCDVAILCLPIPSVMSLQMNRGQRVLVLATFLLGGYVTFTSVYRFVVFLGFTPDDQPYTLSPGMAWNVVEISSGIVGTCLPTLGPIVRMLWRNLIPSTNRSATNQSSSIIHCHAHGGDVASASTANKSPGALPRWEKLQDPKTPRPEEAKYGIGLDTMYQNISDEGLELVVRTQVDVDVVSTHNNDSDRHDDDHHHHAAAATTAASAPAAPVGSSVTIFSPVCPARTSDQMGGGGGWPLAPPAVPRPPPGARMGRRPSFRL